MIRASKATDAYTMPGPPRAFSATARFAWLMEPGEQLPRAVGCDQQQHEGEQQMCDVAVGQAHVTVAVRARGPDGISAESRKPTVRIMPSSP
jgi:hypothetical protein